MSGEEGRIPAVAERLVRLWPEATGDSGPMPRGALRLALSQAWLESRVAEAGGEGGWKGAMVGSGNLGAIQCARNAAGEGFDCVTYSDKHSDGTPYSITFRYYKEGGGHSAGDNAALDFLRHIATPKKLLRDPSKPQSFESLKTGDPRAFAESLYNQRYYEGSGSTDEERIAGYTRLLEAHLAVIDQVLDGIYGAGAEPSVANAMLPDGGGDPDVVGRSSLLPALLIGAGAFVVLYAAVDSFSKGSSPFDDIKRALAERQLLR